MNNLQEFTNGDIKLPVRLKENGDIEFDVEKAAIGLGIFENKNGKKYVIWKRISKYLSTQVSKGDFITEPQFYKLAIKANNETAEKFQDWVTSEVLPSIRKHGAYLTPEKIEEALLNPDTIINLAKTLKEERGKRLIAEQRVNELQPKADYYDHILANKGLVTTTSIAKNYGWSAIKLNKELHRLGIQFTQSGSWYLYSKYQDHGYTHTEPFVYQDKDGNDQVKPKTKWTQKGHIFIYELLKKNDVLPMIERR